jgi:urea transport system permease protein
MRPTPFSNLTRWMFGVLLGLMASTAAHALTPEDAMSLVAGGSDERIATLNRLASEPDPKAAELIRALADQTARIQGERVLILQDETAQDAVTGEPVTLDEYAEEPMLNNRMRGALDFALAGMELAGGDKARQREAALILQRGSFDEPDAEQLPVIEKALAGQLDDEARQTLELAQAAVMLASDDAAQRLEAANKLGEARKAIVRPLLMQRMEREKDPAVNAALKASLAGLDRSLAISSALAEAFTGVSLGSILLLAALGLAITYGLMGVINMAHGELIMIGAYATWLVQAFFKNALPGLFDWYLLAAVPVAFLASALVGAVMERTVIRCSPPGASAWC